jgi:hypothetical protein
MMRARVIANPFCICKSLEYGGGGRVFDIDRRANGYLRW